MINFIKKHIFWIIGVIILLVIIFSLFTKNAKNTSRYQNNLNILENELIKSTLKNGDSVVSKQSLLVTKSEFKDEIFIKDSIIKELSKKFKKVSSAIKIETVNKVKIIKVPYDKPVPFNFNKSFIYKDDYVTLSGISNQEGINEIDIIMPVDLTIVSGVKSKFFQKTITTDVSSNNPYLQIKNLQSQVIEIKTNRFGIGIFAGLDYTGNPTIGVGLNFNIISF